MIKLKNILIESRVGYKSITLNGALDIYNKYCSNFDPDRHFMFRGVSKANTPYFHVDPTKYKRTSFSTKNFYTLIIDNSSAWKKYPDRSQSLICTNSRAHTILYGETYAVIPYDGSDIAIAPTSDIWNSFDEINDMVRDAPSLPTLNETLDELSRIIFGQELPDKNNFVFKMALDQLGKRILDDNIFSDYDLSSSDYGRIIPRVVDKFKKSGEKSMYDFLEKLLRPNENEFRIIKSPPPKQSKVVEMWTSSKSLLISADYWKEFKEEIK